MLLIFSYAFVLLIGCLEFKFSLKQKYTLLLITFIYIFILVGFRNMGGSDFFEYRDQFIYQIDRKWEQGYLLISKIFRFLQFDYRAFILIITLINLSLLFSSIKKYSPLWLMSLSLYMSSFLVYYNIIALRQMFAISLFIYSYRFIEEKKLLPFLLLNIIGFYFHKSAFLCLLAYPFCNYIRLTKKSIIILCTFSFILSFYNYDSLNSLVSNDDAQELLAERFEQYTVVERSIPLTTYFKLGLIFFILKYKYNTMKNKPYFLTLTSLFFMYVCFFIAFHRWAVMMRIYSYFEVAYVFLIPLVFKELKLSSINRCIIYFFILCVFGSSLVRNVLNFDGGDLMYYGLQWDYYL